MDDATAYEHLDLVVADENIPERTKSKHAGRTQLERARALLDIVSMQMDSREFAHYKETDSLAAINLYSDASPVVGTDLQGMVMDCISMTTQWFAEHCPAAFWHMGVVIG